MRTPLIALSLLLFYTCILFYNINHGKYSILLLYCYYYILIQNALQNKVLNENSKTTTRYRGNFQLCRKGETNMHVYR